MKSPLDVAIAAAREAGEVLAGHFGRLDPASVQEKGANDVVSIADKESEAVIRRAVLGEFPADRFLGEETGLTGVDETSPSWIVDPLDGTANFVRGFPHWAVSIARTRGGLLGEIEAGVVWDPLKNDLFTAELGSGAFRNGRRLRVPPRPGLRGAALATGFPFRQAHKIDRYLEIFRSLFLKVRSMRRAGSAALDLAYVGAGIFDGFFEFGLSPWDAAAGALIVTEAGGLISDFDGFGSWRTRGNILAATPGVHAALVAAVKDLGVEEKDL
ncbi:MAG TPA: inositol monophosphatase family protein [Thermoanaerobaculia bacterium]|nr:inositol monophosphatase family protein [Thermoanaerobaculia bacterium]